MGGRSGSYKSTVRWEGGTPFQKDRFRENANRLGLDIHRERIPVSGGYTFRDYVILKSPLTLYHNTDKSNASSIKSKGLIPSDRGGDQVSGVYLTGGINDLSGWADNNVTLSVTLPSGTKLYKDPQPNAVFVRENIPANRIRRVQ